MHNDLITSKKLKNHRTQSDLGKLHIYESEITKVLYDEVL